MPEYVLVIRSRYAAADDPAARVAAEETLGALTPEVRASAELVLRRHGDKSGRNLLAGRNNSPEVGQDAS